MAYSFFVVLLVLYLGGLWVKTWPQETEVKAAEVLSPTPVATTAPQVATVTPSPIPTPEALAPSIKDLVEFHFKEFGDGVVKEALLVAKCESGLRAGAENLSNRNGSNDQGVFQINSVHQVAPRFLKDPYVNIAIAKKLYIEQGWQPWYSSNKCHKLLRG